MALTPNQIVLIAIIALCIVVLVVGFYLYDLFGWFAKSE
jgi:uncharacterized membrane protein YqiK